MVGNPSRRPVLNSPKGQEDRLKQVRKETDQAVLGSVWAVRSLFFFPEIKQP